MPTTDRNTAVGALTTTLFEDWPIPCESAFHDNPQGAGIPDHGGPARYWQQGRCRHTTGFRCEPSVLTCMGSPRMKCVTCKSSWPITEFDFQRLE